MDGESFGRYRLRGQLGAGGMGQVFRAYDTETDRMVALKVLPSDLASDAEYQERFQHEAQVAARLNAPHVVPIHGYGEIGGRLYLDMALIDGSDLGKVLVQGPVDPARAVRIIEQVADALDAAHAAGLVHRDVKPSNIVLARRDFVYLIDFGIAQLIGGARITRTGGTRGTPAYMSPERFDTGEATPRSDIYALTCVLHECLTGRSPFAGDSLEQQIRGHLTSPPPKPSQLRAEIPAAFDDVIAKGMAKDPDERFSTALDLAAAALAALAGAADPVTSVDESMPRPAAGLDVAALQRTQEAQPTRLDPQTFLPDSTSAPTSRAGLPEGPAVGEPGPVSSVTRPLLRLAGLAILAGVVILAVTLGNYPVSISRPWYFDVWEGVRQVDDIADSTFPVSCVTFAVGFVVLGWVLMTERGFAAVSFIAGGIALAFVVAAVTADLHILHDTVDWFLPVTHTLMTMLAFAGRAARRQPYLLVIAAAGVAGLISTLDYFVFELFGVATWVLSVLWLAILGVAAAMLLMRPTVNVLQD